MANKYWWRDDEKETDQQDTSQTTQTTNKTGNKYWWRDEENTTSGVSGQNQQSAGSYWWRADDAPTAAENITKRVNTWLENHNNYITNYTNRYSGRRYNYYDAYVSDSAAWLSTISQQKSNFDAEADSILSYMDQYKDYLDADWMEQVRSTLTKARSAQSTIFDASTKDNEWWSSFGSEELVAQYGSAEAAYKYYQRAEGYSKKYSGQTYADLQKTLSTIGDGEEKDWLTSYAFSVDYDEKSKFDVAAGEAEIQELIDYYHKAQDILLDYTGDPEEYDRQYAKLYEKYGSHKELETLINEKKKYLDSAKKVQYGIQLAGVGDTSSKYYDPEFSKHSVYVDQDEFVLIPDYKDVVYDVVNNNGDTSKIAVGKGWGRISDPEEERLDAVEHMTDEERGIYNYYYSKHGYDKAEEYLDSIIETLNHRKASAAFESYKGNVVLEELFAISAGLDQANSGLRNLFSNKDYIPTSSTQYLSGMIRDDLGDTGFKLPDWMGGASIGQVGYDFLSTSANMAPSMLVGATANVVVPGSGALVGAAMMGGSAAGNAYQEALNAGYDKGQARAYSTLVGASEAGLQYLMGGIGKLGGKLSGKAATSIASKFNNAYARLAVQYGTNMLSEGAEEYLQEILTPVFKNIALGTDEEIELITEEAIYSFLLGALTSGMGEVTGITSESGKGLIGNLKDMSSKNQENIDAVKMYGNFAADLIKEGLASPTNSESYQMAEMFKRKRDKGQAMSGYEIRQLVEANEKQITAETFADTTSKAKSLLQSLGETENVDKIAKLVAKRVSGQELTRAEISTLARSQYGAQVAKEMRQANQAESGTKSFDAAYKSLEDRVGTETRFSVSESGNATIRESGEEIDLANFKEVSKLESGELSIKLADDREVNASDIDFANDEQAYLFSAIADIENITPKAATALIKGYDPSSGQPVGEYLNGIDEAYSYGYHGYSELDLKAGDFTPKLTDVQMMSAYKLGQSARKISNDNKKATFKQMRTAALVEKTKQGNKSKNLTITYNEGGGKVVNFDETGMELSDKQAAAPKLVKILHSLGLGTRFEFFSSFESKTMTVKDKKTGEVKPARVFINDAGVEQRAYSGVYRKLDGTIRIDLNAYNGRGLTLNAMAHELTHFIQQWSDSKYQVLADFLIKTYEKTDMTMHERVLKEQKRLEDIRGEKVSYNEAYDEVVANAMSKMLDDGKLVERLTALKSKDKKLAKKLWEGIKNIIAKFTAIYEKEGALFKDAADLMEMKDTFEQLQNMFAEALVEASENYQASLTPGVEGTVYAKNGEAIAHSTEDGSVQFSLHTYDTEGRDLFRSYLEKCVSSKQLTKTEMQEMLDGIEEIYNVCKEFKDKYAPFGTWSDAAVVRDTYGKPVFSVVTPNGEYKMNLDFSLVCKKRRTLDAVFNEMAKRGIIDDFELGQKSVVKINEIIRKHGFETACALCFVDAKRFRQASMADSFTNLYNELVLSLVPESKRSSIDHFNFSGYETIKKVEGGIDTWDASKLDFSHIDEVLKNYAKGTVEYKAAQYIKTHAEGRKLLLRGDFMSSKGFDAVKTQNKTILSLYNSKKGTGGPKAAFGDVQYMNEIISKAKNWTPAKAYAVGGVRIQSFSDYVPRMVFDYVQMVYDLAATKLPAHAYTKEALFAKQFGLTGIKINMSLIPAIAKDGIAPGLDANGNYVWAGESFDFETAKEIQNAEGYTENCGTICVGVSDLHIRKLLADPNIRMVIPYHKSGLNPIVAHMNRIAEFTDYTGSQNTLDRNGKKLAKDFDFDKVLHKMGENGDPKAVIEEYLNWCDTNGYTPKFSQFRDNPNYYKLIEDFTLYDKDGNYVPQRGVQAVFPADGSAFGSMKSLIEAGLQEDAVIEGKRDKSLSSIVDEIEQSLPKTEAEIPETEVKQADHDLEAGEQYSSQETDRDRITLSMTDAERTAILQKKSVVAEVYAGQAEDAIKRNKAHLESDKMGLVKSALVRIGEEFRIFTDYDIADVEVKIRLSKGNIKESVSKEITPTQIAKLLPVLKTAVENAVGIESHANRYFYDDSTVFFENLLGGYVDGKYFVPVRFGLKHSTTGEATLYVIVDQQPIESKKIKAEVVKIPETQQNVSPAISHSAFKVSVANLAGFVNGKDLLRYLPDDMLSAEQKKTKWEGIAETVKKTDAKNDAKYTEFLASGNLQAVQNMVNQAAKVAGAMTLPNGKVKAYYHGTNEKFTSFDLDKARQGNHGFGFYFSMLKDFASEYGDTIGVYLMTDRIATHEDHRITADQINAVVDRFGLSLENTISRYADSIEEWVSYKDDCTILQDLQNFIVRETDAKASEFLPFFQRTFGYDGLRVTRETVLWDNKLIKSADPITYDDSDNVIPISQRFDTEKDEYRYSLQEVDPVQPSTDKWKRTLTTAEAKTRFPSLWDVTADDSDVRNPTQISSTVKSYRKIYEYLKAEGFDGNILDASSGLGYGTRAGIEEYGFDVEDIEPYPDKSYNPKYRDYSALNKKYDVIISNAVLNVLPQDQRDALVVKMGELLKDGGRIFINVRGKDVDTLASTKTNVNISPMEWFVGSTGSYQKGFTKPELVAYLQDALGSGYRVNPTSMFGAVSAVVTKESADLQKDALYSTHETDYSNRSLLANAFEGITKSSPEYEMIQEYKGHIKDLNELEAKLSDLNAEIRKIRFGTTGPRDTARLTQIEEEAKKVAKEINRYDKRLLSLEASEPLRKVIERERKKEAQKTKEHVKEIQQNKKVRAEQTELRHKIRKAIRDLDKILNRGNKKQNVKEDLQPVVTKALQAAEILFTDNYGNYDMLRNGIGADMSDSEEALVATCAKMLKDLDKMPTDGYDNWQARQEAENRLKTKMSNLKDVFARERKRLNNTTVSSILGELADAYASLEKSEQSYVQGAYIEPVHNFLKNLQSEVGGTIVRDMTKDQLKSVYAAYQMVLNTVRNANKMFNEDLKQSREQLGNAVIEEVLKAGGVHLLGTKMGDAISQFDWNNMKPIWVANRIGSESFAKLMQGLFDGQYNFARDIDEVKQFKLSMDEKYKPRNWDAEKLYEFESSTGKKFSLNLQQIMSLYAYTKRGKQAFDHLISGGFVFEDNSTVVVDGKLGIKRTYIHKGATSYKLNEATLNGIINSLTAEQKAYVDDMQAFLSNVMGAKGNEVSMKLYGIKMFNEKFYFPLRSSGAYMERAKEAELKKQQGQINLVNSGFTHSVKPEAKNPIVLSGFMDVWAEHCNEMSMYHSMVLPMEDFRKVYNYSTIHDEKMESASVYQTIQDAYGKAATGYIDQLYKELNAGATVDPRETPYKKLISNFKKSAVILSGSVVVQQFSSIGRAYAVIDPKYFIGTKVNSDTKLATVEEMKKYAPVAIIKEMGGFDTGTKGNATAYIKAEKYGKGERIKGLVKDSQYRGDIMGYLPAKADELTWCAIWEAAKRETKANHPKMDVKSEEFLKLAGERFSEVIEKTQVYDSVLARSANMRSKGNFMAMATAFMAEPTTTVNLIEDAIRSGKAKNIARAFGSVAVSIVLNNALASIVYAMRDDDEDETFIEKYFQSFTSGMIDDLNPMSYYPFLKDVYALFQGYDVERSDMSVIADVRDALKKVVSAIGKYDSDMDDDEVTEFWKTVNDAMMSLLDAGCSMFGVPVKNVRRDVNGIINAWNTIGKDISGERDTTWLSFWDKVGAAAKDTIPVYAWTKDESKTDKLYRAIASGDKSYLARLKSTYKTDSAYNSAVVTALRENDPRVHAAAQAGYEGNSEERNRIFKEIKADLGAEYANLVIDAINSELNAIRNDAEPKKVNSQYDTDGFVEAVADGNLTEARAIMDDIVSTHVANGKTQADAEAAFQSSVRSSIRTAYSYSSLTRAETEKMLVEYADMDEEEAASKVAYWAFCEEHPEYDFSEANVNDYLEFAEPANISLEVYEQFIKGTKGLADIKDEWGDVEVSKRDQVLEVIDSLPLTWEQKDALYLAAGYAESKIWDVPW